MGIRDTFRSIFGRKTPSVNDWSGVIGRAYQSAILNPKELNPVVDDVVSHISNTISTLPLSTYRYTKKGVIDAYYTDTARVLKNPSYELSRTMWMKTLVRHLLVKGNAYIRPIRVNGKVAQLQLIDPRSVTITRQNDGSRLFTIDGFTRPLGEEDIIHIPYYGEGLDTSNGLGRSPLEVHRDVVSENLYIREWISTYFHHGVGSRMLASMDSDIYKPTDASLPQQVQYLKDFFSGNLSGVDNAGKVLLLPPGVTTTAMNLPSNSEAEVHSLLMDSNANLCRIFNMPPQYLFPETQKSTTSSISDIIEEYYRVTIRPLCEHIASYLERLIPDDEIEGEYVAFSYSDMLETNISAKQDRLQKAFHAGLISLAEFRSEMRLPAIEDETVAQTRWIPSNLVPLRKDTIESYLAKSKLALKELDEDRHDPSGLQDKMQ